MACDHLGPPEIVELAEAELRSRGVGESRWSGVRVTHVEHLPQGAMWGTVVIGLERRGDDWVVTKIDRLKEATSDRAGLYVE